MFEPKRPRFDENAEEEVCEHKHSLPALRALGERFKNVDAAAAEIARLEGEMYRKKRNIHLISDIHGEDRKLRHVLNNASGMLRPVVLALFENSMNEREINTLLNLIYYPQQTMDHIEAFKLPFEKIEGYFRSLLQVIWHQIENRSVFTVSKLFPEEYSQLLTELLYSNRNMNSEISDGFITVCFKSLESTGKHLHFLRLLARIIRNLSVDELVVAGDLYDRGTRGDKVVDVLMQQPNAWVTWGNHDVVWLGACLGQMACIAHVLRVSVRYNVLQQLEEGYGIPIQPLQKLAETVYKDDPAPCHKVKLKEGATRSGDLMGKMQKAAAILMQKVEGQVIQNNPDFDLDHRRLLHYIDHEKGTVTIDGVEYDLKDKHFPTIDKENPYALSLEEQECMDSFVKSFRGSTKMWRHMQWLVHHGSMYAIRDNHVIFHGAVPVDENGLCESMEIDKKLYSGKELFDIMNTKILSSIQDGKIEANRDWCWYLWCGPKSPLFGKDKIATFERDFIEEGPSWVETKNAYFELIHDENFCEKICQMFNCQENAGIIVNGHVPVKIKAGENPVKKSNRAVTIDGAFSEAYGDKGYTMIIEPQKTLLAEHSHFESIAASLNCGHDMIPKVWSICDEASSLRNGKHNELIIANKEQICFLKQLISAYKHNYLQSM